MLPDFFRNKCPPPKKKKERKKDRPRVTLHPCKLPVKASGRAGLEECNLTPPPAGKLESRLEGRKAAFKNLSGGLRFHLFLLFPSSHEMAYFSGRILIFRAKVLHA